MREGHRDGLALLSTWYALLSEKRAWKTDFLRQLCRAFDYDLGPRGKVDDGFALYIADNLAGLEYKLQEEVMTVIHLVSSVISSAAHLVSVLESGVLEGEAKDNIVGKTLQSGDSEVRSRVDRPVAYADLVRRMAKSHSLRR